METETRTVVLVTTVNEIDEYDLRLPGGATILDVEGTYTMEQEVEHPDFVGLTAAEVAADLLERPIVAEEMGVRGHVRKVTVTRPNPAYSGPDALFPDMTPPETITETVTL